MTIDINQNSALRDSTTPGYSSCGCGNRRYYTKAEIDEMLKGVLDPEEIEELLDQMFTEYIEGGDLYELILNALGDVYSKEQIDNMLSSKLDVTAFTQAMSSETARTENTYAKKSDIPSGDYATEEWVEDQGYLKDITLTINGTPLHNNGEIIIEGGGGEPVDISGKLDTSAFTAYTSSTETWENNMEDCCDEVKSYMNYLRFLIDDLQRQIDEIQPSPTPTPTPTGDTFTLTAVYDVTSTTEETKIIAVGWIRDNGPKWMIDKFTYNGVDYSATVSQPLKFTFPETGEQTIQIHFIGTTIPEMCFYQTPLKRVTIPNGITTIQKGAFEYTHLTDIVIPNSVTSISENALNFAYSSLQTKNCTLTIGTGVTSIGSWNAPRYKGTTTITMNATTPPTVIGDKVAFPSINNNTLTVYVPANSVNAYKATANLVSDPNVIQAKP